ncbi:hypothetical protein HX137_06650 [Pseudomonas sp. 165]|uniref:hypothetical protein n=1 Tax=Pseudomonas TaxID=286 RepID=UPI000CD3EF54|nr:MULTISPECIES: hypothetical protein [Pseudomonas]MCE1084178.1 hypothetical protein [Pseudomonas asiatica]MDM1710313.1 hypothetical protein [Pseudomonas sp. 165]
MKIATAVLAIAITSSSSASAAFYTEEPDPAYEKASIALFCMNHFYNRTKGHLGTQAGMAAQADLAGRLSSLPDGEKLADNLRLALDSITKDEGSKAVSPFCWQYIPQDHGLTTEQIEHFLKHSSLD